MNQYWVCSWLIEIVIWFISVLKGGVCLFLDYKFGSIFCYQILKIIRDFTENYKKHITHFTFKYLNITKKKTSVMLSNYSQFQLKFKEITILVIITVVCFPVNILNIRVPSWLVVSNGIYPAIEPVPSFNLKYSQCIKHVRGLVLYGGTASAAILTF